MKIDCKTLTRNKKNISFILILSLILILFIGIVKSKNKINEETVLGKIYFNKPASWEYLFAYLYDENGDELLGEWPGTELIKEKDYIYYVDIKQSMISNAKDILNCKIIFNNGENGNCKIEENCEGYNKIYNITSGIGEKYYETTGEWLEYYENIPIGKIPTTNKDIKNIIYMIGDGMGENHIIAGELYKGEELNIQTIENKSYIKTASTSTVTDSAAAATALATGHKTINGMVGIDKDGNNLENIIEYANLKGLKTGVVCTQILNHATPASFLVHNNYRYNYYQIAQEQIRSNIDIMLGGGRLYFNRYENEIRENGFRWINNISELNNIDKNEKIIGTLANESISKENERTNLADMVKETLGRLENENGFLVMIEGSDIDTYSHDNNMKQMLVEMIDFDNAVGVAMEYVDNNPDTLLIITADHETGGLILDNITSKEQLNNECFTSNGQHTQKDVPIYAYGLGENDITQYDIIDNTSIFKFIKQALNNTY